MLNEEESFIGVADFEQEVVKNSYINNQNEETLFDDDIMHSLLQGITNDQALQRAKGENSALPMITTGQKNKRFKDRRCVCSYDPCQCYKDDSLQQHLSLENQHMLNNPLENDSQDSSFFNGSSFINEQGRALANNISAHNLEELLHQADDVDPGAFLIR